MPRCADASCGRWRPERLAPKWASGLRLNGSWYCSRTCVELAARASLAEPAASPSNTPTLPPLRLGVLLRHLGAVSDSALESALASQAVSGRRLGAELRHRGLCGADQVLKALAAQHGTSYIASFDVARVTNGPGWLPVDTVRALGLVPFEVDDLARTVRVVCRAPAPRAALRALLRLTGWTAEPYLVHDEIWEEAMAVYRTDGPDTGEPAELIKVHDVAAAASRVADTAVEDRAVTMRHAMYDRMTWVRVESPRQLSDLLVTDEEAPCPAERIAR